jgi:hypothetical protein
LKRIGAKGIIILAAIAIVYMAIVIGFLMAKDPRMENDAFDNDVGFVAGVGFVALLIAGYLVLRRKT